MKKLVALSFLILAVACWFFMREPDQIAASAARGNPQTPEAGISSPVSARASVFAESSELRAMQIVSTWKLFSAVPRDTKLLTLGRGGESQVEASVASGDGGGSLVQFGGSRMPEPSLSFDGIANIDNANIFGLLIIPPDMNGDVGPNHYVQIVNSLVRVYSKDASPVTSPIKLSDVFGPLNTPCSERNDGLPNVLYDPLADRWLISQVCHAFAPFRQMVAVSKTSDPAGQYFLYEFVMPNVKINDFPKFGVWVDGYYMTTDEFLGADYVGNGMFAFDRRKMLVGDPSAAYIYFHRPATDQIRRGGMLPVDIDGLRGPNFVGSGSLPIFASYTATEYGDAIDGIRLFDFQADFANPPFSRFTERPESPIAVAVFDPTSPPGRQDISQPPPGEFLDSVSDRLNPRLAYRNFGNYESLTVNQTVRVSPVGQPFRAGVRVYELRRSGGAYTPVVQTTIGTPDASRWIGAVAQDHQGNIAVEYNHVTDDKQPSILYSGRLAADAPGVFRPEAKLVVGTGVQKAFGWRWGEYSGMTVDPADDCTFWITNAYYTLESENISDFTWLTRIGRFKFDECTPAPRVIISGTVTNAATGLPLEDAQIDSHIYSRTTTTDGRYGPMYALPGRIEINASAKGFRSASFVTTLDDGQTLVRNFALQPVAVLENTGFEIIRESCSIDRSLEPGERVTINLSLTNTGAAPTQNLTGDLLPILGVTDPSPPQSFGSIPVGSAITRSYSFTVSPDLKCGDPVNIVLSLADGLSGMPSIQIMRQTGEPRIAFQENFDSATAPNLPSGWTTSSTENHQLWRTSTTRKQSSPTSLFSPAPIQQGVNEVVSPQFRVVSTDAELSFRNWYELETTFLRNRLYDGSVLEIQIGSGAWQDIVTAGGQFLIGGYDGFIDACCQNPLAGRAGWSGRSGTGLTSQFITSRVKLPPAAAGQDVRIRFRVGSDIGGFREGQYIDDITVTDGVGCDCNVMPEQRGIFDFDGDQRTDLSVFSFSDSQSQSDFRVVESSSGGLRASLWGSTGDLAANADYDGDGKTDLAVFRPAEGNWYVLNSSDGAVSISRFGSQGDKPLPSDFDGDGLADAAVYRPQTGTWYVSRTSDARVAVVNFGLASDVPTPGDYDGDGVTDFAAYRPSTGVWYSLRSAGGAFMAVRFGIAEDKPVPGDFDGDSTTDLAVFRPSTGTWYLKRSQGAGSIAVRFGLPEDRPLQADFDGDGRADIAVFRPSTGVWYYLKSSDSSFAAVQFGVAGEQPVPSIYVTP